MSYGENPNKTYMSDFATSAETAGLMPNYPEVFLNVGNHAIWWTGTITGYIWGDDCITWIAPIVRNSPTSPTVVDYLSACPIQSFKGWKDTMWADRPEGPSNNEFLQIEEQVRNFTLLASRFRGALRTNTKKTDN